ncbi:MAG: glycosyltransferase [Halieaceae bacterium]
MRILHLGKFYWPYNGGIENVTRLLAEGAQARGADVLALVHADAQSRRPRHESIDSVAVHRSRSFGRLVYAPFAPFFLVDLWRALREQQADIVHVHLPNLSAFWLFLCPPAWGRKWLLHWHADVEFRPEQRLPRLLYQLLYRPLEFLLLHLADAVIVTSPNYLASSKALAAFQGKCVVVPLATVPITASAADVMEAGPTGVSTGWPDTGLRILMVGRMTAYKGHAVLLSALAELSASGDDFHAVLIGSGELEPQLTQQIIDLDLASSVTLAGQVNDAALDEYLGGCDLLCLPSLDRAEAFGMVLLEAMAHGKPVVASALADSGVDWVVEDNVSGWKFPVGDSAALADRLRWCMQNRESLVEAGRQGRKRQLALFSADAVIAQTMQIYEDLCDQDA